MDSSNWPVQLVKSGREQIERSEIRRMGFSNMGGNKEVT
jgi:hypothetical protein